MAPGRLTARQVDLLLELLVALAFVSGLASWTLGDTWNGLLTTVHGSSGLALALLVPAKMRGSVRTGFARGRSTRWVSAAFGVLVLATLALGILHATGLWFGVGQWSPLWTHELFGFVSVLLLVWHVATRPSRPGFADLDRRAAIRSGVIGSVAVGLAVVQRPLAGLAGLAGGERRHTGSHEIASHDPDRMPTVIWLNDARPDDTGPDGWHLEIGGDPTTIEELRDRSRPLTATIDCTGGWFSEQRWDVVPVADLIGDRGGRSIRVGSSTGYWRLFPRSDAGDLYLATGYGGQPLRAGHGAPVRLVVPGRRGFEWVKWVDDVRVVDRPSWAQWPLPLS